MAETESQAEQPLLLGDEHEGWGAAIPSLEALEEGGQTE